MFFFACPYDDHFERTTVREKIAIGLMLRLRFNTEIHSVMKIETHFYQSQLCPCFRNHI